MRACAQGFVEKVVFVAVVTTWPVSPIFKAVGCDCEQRIWTSAKGVVI